MGIHVPSGSELIVEGTGGTLNAYISSESAIGMAGIGGNSHEDAGTITIRNGANVTAKGCRSGAGIGGGIRHDYSGTIRITGGNDAAGIGAAKEGNAKDGVVTISGGTVTATGKGGAAGIGGGKEGSFPHYQGGEGATVNITGGTVIVNSDFCAIGHGKNDHYMGFLTIGDDMKVQAGNNGTDYERIFTAGERVDACHYRSCARIEVCDHSESTYVSDEEGHSLPCRYCLATTNKSPHEFEEVEGSAVDATCVQPGKDADQKCKVCCYVKVGRITGYGDHNWGEVTYAWNDDNSEVTASRVCRRDHEHVDSETVTTTSVTKEATCSEPGTVTYTAEFEGAFFEKQEKTVETDSALGHDWGEWTTTQYPTESETGSKKRTCKRNSEHEEEMVIPPLVHVHQMKHVDAVPAACETHGDKAHYECSTCGGLYEDVSGAKQLSGSDIVIPATGHKAGQPVKGTVAQADCSNIGGYNLTTKCETCGRVIGVERVIFPVDPDTHIWDEGTVTKEASETETGIRKYTCLNDPSHTRTEVIPKTTPSAPSEDVQSAASEAVQPAASEVLDPSLPTIKNYKPVRIKAGIKVRWKKLSNRKGRKVQRIEIQYSTNRKFPDGQVRSVNAKKNAKTKTIKKLSRKAAYYTRIRTYKVVGCVKYVSKWSAIKKIKK